MTESERYSLPWHGNLYQGERASEKRGIAFGHAKNSADIVGHPDGGPALGTPVHGKTSDQNVQTTLASPLTVSASPRTFSAGPLREELALARRILDLSRNPSKARDLCLVLVRRLERLTEAAEAAEVG
jgi:hypothetical protein